MGPQYSPNYLVATHFLQNNVIFSPYFFYLINPSIAGASPQPLLPGGIPRRSHSSKSTLNIFEQLKCNLSSFIYSLYIWNIPSLLREPKLKPSSSGENLPHLWLLTCLWVHPQTDSGIIYYLCLVKHCQYLSAVFHFFLCYAFSEETDVLFSLDQSWKSHVDWSELWLDRACVWAEHSDPKENTEVPPNCAWASFPITSDRPISS